MQFSEIDNPVFIIWAFCFQLVLIAHFAIRKINFNIAIQYGWIVYALSIVGLIVSIHQLNQGKSWTFWVGGFIFLVWASLGFGVEYVFEIPWRAPINWRIFIPYVCSIWR